MRVTEELDVLCGLQAESLPAPDALIVSQPWCDRRERRWNKLVLHLASCHLLTPKLMMTNVTLLVYVCYLLIHFVSIGSFVASCSLLGKRITLRLPCSGFM